MPSCPTHNHAQSLDIEYARNVITGFYGVNPQGEEAFDAAKRSFDRNSVLFHQTFGDFETIHFHGEQTGTFTIDLDGMKSVMIPIANAIHFKDYGEEYAARWNVFTASLGFRDRPATPAWQEFRKLLATIRFVARPAPHPEIFTYAVGEMAGGLALEFVFYGAFKVYCFGPRT